jgi:hypothetical protein
MSDGGWTDDAEGCLHAFVTSFAVAREAITGMTAAQDARRRLNYSEKQQGVSECDSAAVPAPAPTLAAAAVTRVSAARRRESGIFYDATSLVLPDQTNSVASKLAELEQEVQGTTPVHACFSSGRVFR